MDTMKYSQASRIPLSGSYLDPILIAVSCDLLDYLSEVVPIPIIEETDEDRLILKSYSDDRLYEALNSIALGKVNPRSRQALPLVGEGIRRRLYT